MMSALNLVGYAIAIILAALVVDNFDTFFIVSTILLAALMVYMVYAMITGIA